MMGCRFAIFRNRVLYIHIYITECYNIEYREKSPGWKINKPSQPFVSSSFSIHYTPEMMISAAAETSIEKRESLRYKR